MCETTQYQCKSLELKIKTRTQSSSFSYNHQGKIRGFSNNKITLKYPSVKPQYNLRTNTEMSLVDVISMLRPILPPALNDDGRC